MRPRQAIKQIYEHSAAARALLFLPVLLYRAVYKRYLQSDRDFIRDAYWAAFGRFPDLENPTTLNEKIQWRKLYDRNPQYAACADKVRVREYVRERAGEACLIPLLLVTKDPDEIDFESLPPRFVVKANHGCRWNELVRDKDGLDREALVRKIKGWLGSNFYRAQREWQYRDIAPRLLVEEMLIDDGGNLPTEYRVFCFDGEAKFLEVVSERFTPDLKVDYYDVDWVHLPVRHDIYENSDAKPRPRELDEMLRLAERLSAGFDFVRVDLYLSGDRVYFGELTFTPSAGYLKFHPPDYDAIFGQDWRVPIDVSR